MIRPSRRALALAAACLLPAAAQAQQSASPPANSNIFDPLRAPEIVIHIGARRIVLAPRSTGSATTLSARAIENKANSSSFSSIIASSVPGAAASSSGELHIRGSHGQYTYYLDGAPLPAGVSGSFSDLIDPKNIETLRVFTGGFPARYGNNIAAVFDVTAKGGRTPRPGGFVQQIGQGYGTYETTGQIGARAGRWSYFASGVHSTTDRRLDPLTPDPIHDAGSDSVMFGKFDYQAGKSDRITLDAARTDARLQIPNSAASRAVGVDNNQRENGGFANLIWRANRGGDALTTAIYSHAARLRYDSRPATTVEDRTANYLGLRTDYATPVGSGHKLGLGFDVNAVTGKEDFFIVPAATDADPNPKPVRDVHSISGGDRAVYLEDDWKGGRLGVNLGARYDVHIAAQTASQLSPRLNFTYRADGRDTFHAYYNRLFQPAAIEDVRRLSGTAALGGTVITGIKPERNHFFEVGWQHENAGITSSLSAYYKTAQDVIDEDTIGDTQIKAPFNVTKGYVRGVELAVDGGLTRDLSFYANYARAWARAAGTITGGFLSSDPPTGYFPVDHDQLDTASVGLAYDHRSVSLGLDGEYGSGFPFDDHGVFRRVAPHFIVNTSAGLRLGSGQLAFTVTNLLAHRYRVKGSGEFTANEWGQLRTYGLKWTQNF